MTTPNTDTTRHIISLGAGVQSTVMLLMASLGIIKPTPIAAVFADTKWEPEQVYEHLQWLRGVSSIPIITVSNDRDLYEDTWSGVGNSGSAGTPIPVWTVSRNGKLGMNKRECTTDYKIIPITRAIRELISRTSKSRTGPIAVQWIGITTDEIMRAKPSRYSWIQNRWPLIEMGLTRSQCLEWFRQRYPDQPLTKSACVGCPYHSDAEWLRLAKTHPQQMEQAIALDEQLRHPGRMARSGLRNTPYLHRSGTPLRQRIAKLEEMDSSAQQLPMLDNWGDECEGLCQV